MGKISSPREENSSIKSLKKVDPVSTGNIDPYSGGEWGETGNQEEERWREELREPHNLEKLQYTYVYEFLWYLGKTVDLWKTQPTLMIDLHFNRNYTGGLFRINYKGNWRKWLWVIAQVRVIFYQRGVKLRRDVNTTRLPEGPIVFVFLLQQNFKSKTKQMMIHIETEGLGNIVFNLPLSWCFLFSHFDLFLPTIKKKNHWCGVKIQITLNIQQLSLYLKLALPCTWS